MGWRRDERNLCGRTRLREPPPCPAGDLAQARKSQGRAGAGIRTPRQSHALCDTAGARGWLGSGMTHPQMSPETLVGSFAQQVLSLMVSELWSGVKPSPVELLERPLLAGEPPHGAQGPLSLEQGMLRAALEPRAEPAPGLIAGLSRHSYRPPTDTGAFPQPGCPWH